jgi:hypothetical protein
MIHWGRFMWFDEKKNRCQWDIGHIGWPQKSISKLKNWSNYMPNKVKFLGIGDIL